jgi:hypothetical protein
MVAAAGSVEALVEGVARELDPDVVVVAGLPGAGKTTLVAGEPRALDSDAIREAWAPRLARLPYPLWRPLVHAWHWVLLWRALKRPEGVVIVRPFTSGRLRRAVLRRARRHHPGVHLVVVAATPAQARGGQHARGRTVREPAMRRHERRWASADFASEPWTTVTMVRRAGLSEPPVRSRRIRAQRTEHGRRPIHQEERSMLSSIRRTAITVVALGALALGGAAIAGAAGKTSSSTASKTRPQREALSSATAAKVKAAALEELPGATVLRTEGGGPYSTAYHAHVKTSGGTLKVVLVDASFEATAVQADQGGGGRGKGGHRGPGGPGAGETALTGETKKKVEAAVKAEYPGATIVRTETNGDSAAPYESHITTSDGKELEVLVSRDFEIVEAREHPARP